VTKLRERLISGWPWDAIQQHRIEGARIALEEAMRIQCAGAVAIVDSGTAFVELRDVVKADRIRRLLSELEGPK
jgi:hypothetical protein